MYKSKLLTFLTSLLSLSAFAAEINPGSDRINVSVRGKGPDVMLIPGLGSSGAVWDETVKHLQSHYRLHVIQIAGFAGAPPKANAEGVVIQPAVSAIDAYIKTNNLKSPAVVGHSLGGLMGLMLADQHPDDVGKLMIVDSLPFFSVLMGATNAAEATPRATAMRDAILAQTQEAFAQSQGQFLAGLVKSPKGRELATKWSASSDKSVMARGLYEAMITDMRPKLAGIKTPTTIVYPWAAITGMSPTGAGAIYQKSFAELPNKTLVRIEDSYHFIMLDQPEKFVEQVDLFLTH